MAASGPPSHLLLKRISTLLVNLGRWQNVENVRVRIAYIQLTTSVELGCKVL